VLCDLKAKGTTADDLLDELTLLPVALRREYQDSIKKEMSEVESRASRSVRHVFHHLINPFSTFLDYKLLEHLISKLGTPKLKQDMECYVADVSKFKHETTVAELMDHWDGIENQSLNYTELKMRFGEDPMNCTLEKLDRHRKKFCSRYKLSELVMILIHLKPGSFIAVWIVPTLLGNGLMESIRLRHTKDKDDDILSFSLAGKQIYPPISGQPARYTVEVKNLIIITSHVAKFYINAHWYESNSKFIAILLIYNHRALNSHSIIMILYYYCRIKPHLV
jgi:hypothetical protein